MPAESCPKNYIYGEGADAVLHQLSDVITGFSVRSDISPEQWPALSAAANAQGLGPMLFWALKSSGHDEIWAHIGPELTEIAHHAAAFDILYEDSIRKISKALASSGIPAVWLKGAMLARTVYPQSSLRPMLDLDVLVPRDQIEPALCFLKNLGYRFDGEVTFRPDKNGAVDENYLKHLALHHYVLIGGLADSVRVELHFGLPAHSGDRLLKTEHMAWFWEQTQPFRLDDGTTCTGLKPEAHLLYLASHHIFQHLESMSCLMRDLDVHLLITQAPPNWDKIIDQAVILGWTGAVSRSLERAVDYFKSPVPKKVFEQLAASHPMNRDPLSVLKKKQRPGYRWEVIREKQAFLSKSEKKRYFFQNLFPNFAYMRSRYGVPASRSIWPYYPYRWFDQGREIIRALVKGSARK